MRSLSKMLVFVVALASLGAATIAVDAASNAAKADIRTERV